MEIVSKKRDKADQAVDEDERIGYLAEESNILRTELKSLNSALNLFIEEMKNMKLKNNKKTLDPAEHEEKKRIVKEKEAENYDKMTKNLIKEHTKLSNRLEMVSDPQYVYDLKDKVEEMKNYVRELKRSKKKLEKQEKNRDKQLNYMINKGGEIGQMRKINDTHNELTVTRNQINKINNRLDQLDDTKANNQEQITALNDKLSRLQTIAQKHNIDIDKVAKEVEKKHDYEDFEEIKKEMLHKKNILENAIKVQKRKYQQIFSKEKKKYEQIIQDREEMNKMLETKQKEAQEKKEMIDELKVKYDKYKTEAGFNNYIKDSEKLDRNSKADKESLNDKKKNHDIESLKSGEIGKNGDKDKKGKDVKKSRRRSSVKQSESQRSHSKKSESRRSHSKKSRSRHSSSQRSDKKKSHSRKSSRRGSSKKLIKRRSSSKKSHSKKSISKRSNSRKSDDKRGSSHKSHR